MKLNEKIVKVKKIEIEEPVKGKKAIMEILIELPDTAWDLEQPKVLINNDRKEIKIIIKGRRSSKGIGLQVITKRKIKQIITFQTSGKWVIECNNKKKIVEVKEKE